MKPKKPLSLIIAFALMLSLISAIPQEVNAGSNLLKNPGFETESGWDLYTASKDPQDSVFTYDTGVRHGGARSLKILLNDISSTAATQKIYDLTGGATYNISGWIYNVSSGRCFFKYTALYLDGGTTKAAEEQSITVPMKNSWQLYNATVKLPDTGVGLEVKLCQWGVSAGSGESIAYFDDISVTMVDTNNHIVNSDFEDYIFYDEYQKNLPNHCKIEGLADYHKNYTLSEEYAYGGKMGLRMSLENKTGIMRSVTFNALDSVSPLTSNDVLPFTYWLRSNCKTGYKFVFYSSESGTGIIDTADKEVGSTGNEWKLIEDSLTVPEGCKRIDVILYNYSTDKGNYADFDEAYLGDLSKKPAPVNIPDDKDEVEAEKAEEEAKKINQPYNGAPSLITNGGFEDSTSLDGNWRYYYDAEFYSITTKEKYEGNQALQITSPQDKWPIAYQILTDGIVPGSSFYFSTYAKVAGGSGVARITFEYFDVPLEEVSGAALAAKGGKGLGSDYVAITVGTGWTNVSASVAIPAGCRSVAVNLRNFTYGTVMYFDNAEFYMTKPAKLIKIDTDDVFYYSDKTGDGTVTVRSTAVYDFAEGDYVDIALKDGDTVLSSVQNIPVSEDSPAEFSFPLNYLKEKKKAYVIEAVCKNRDGGVVDTQTQNVYKYDRPTYLTQDGKIEIDGEPFYPKFALACDSAAHYPAVKALGFTAVCAYGSQIDGLISQLEKNGLKAMVPLYFSMKPAGHPDTIDWVQSIVKKYKDSPVILGWQTMDEPLMNLSSEDYDWLMEASYKAIRDVDPNHPVMVVDASDKDLNLYKEQAKYCDVVISDAYTAYQGNASVESYVIEHIEAAVKGTKDEKPVYYAAGTFERNGYFTNSNEHRNVMWQSFFCGAKGFGIYPFINVFNQGGTTPPRAGNLDDAPIYPELVKINTTGEMDMAIKHFVYNETLYFNGNRDENVWWEAWVDGSDMYIIILNRKNSEKQIAIPMTSYDGSVSVNKFNAVMLDGGDIAPYKVTDGVLKHTLTPYQAAYFRITLDENVDFGTIPAKTFIDLDGYGWASEAIEALRAKDIVQGINFRSYGPGEKIKRGDFAMSLIRTLGLKSDSTENFSDVSGDAYYSKEIAAGKALGILEGMGDGNFNPEAFISRQDMMTICVRGLKAAGKSANGDASVLDSFKDKDEIAGYAGEAVSAMVQRGIVIGNDDGRINPLGNATRAESAVIMYRIINS